MKILISNSSKEPIYEQIYEQIKNLILSEELLHDEALPSIRGLARDLGISVITTKRAYDELENDGYIYTVPGKGSYVTRQNKELLMENKIRTIEEKLEEVIEDSKIIGLSHEELLAIFNTLYKGV